MERDPLLLSSLMWSWLEQLKEPIINIDDLEVLTSCTHNPLHALNALEKVQTRLYWSALTGWIGNRGN